MRKYKSGELVCIIQRQAKGYKFEGMAKVMGPDKERGAGHYIVQFFDGSKESRFIDDDAQKDPEVYIASLNAGFKRRRARGEIVT